MVSEAKQETMTHQAKLDWLALWCARQDVPVALALKGECGFGRECVGILVNDHYPEYEWFDDENFYERADKNGDVWRPEDAYHKHECIAVLGRGEQAESQLYEWVKWFDDNGFVLETGSTGRRDLHPVEVLMGNHTYQRMVKKKEQ